jgi:hypothetical protein
MVRIAEESELVYEIHLRMKSGESGETDWYMAEAFYAHMIGLDEED